MNHRMSASAPVFKFLAHLPPLPRHTASQSRPFTVNSRVRYPLSARDITYDYLAMNKCFIRTFSELGTVISKPKPLHFAIASPGSHSLFHNKSPSGAPGLAPNVLRIAVRTLHSPVYCVRFGSPFGHQCGKCESLRVIGPSGYPQNSPS